VLDNLTLIMTVGLNTLALGAVSAWALHSQGIQYLWLWCFAALLFGASLVLFALDPISSKYVHFSVAFSLMIISIVMQSLVLAKSPNADNPIPRALWVLAGLTIASLVPIVSLSNSSTLEPLWSRIILASALACPGVALHANKTNTNMTKIMGRSYFALAVLALLLTLRWVLLDMPDVVIEGFGNFVFGVASLAGSTIIHFSYIGLHFKARSDTGVHREAELTKLTETNHAAKALADADLNASLNQIVDSLHQDLQPQLERLRALITDVAAHESDDPSRYRTRQMQAINQCGQRLSTQLHSIRSYMSARPPENVATNLTHLLNIGLSLYEKPYRARQLELIPTTCEDVFVFRYDHKLLLQVILKLLEFNLENAQSPRKVKVRAALFSRFQSAILELTCVQSENNPFTTQVQNVGPTTRNLLASHTLPIFIAYTVIKELGGEIETIRSHGQQAVFRVTLPLHNKYGDAVQSGNAEPETSNDT
jgi:signal transduction histidine kinase